MSDTLRPCGPVAHRAPLSMGFSGQKYWSGLLCLPPGDFPNQGIEPMSLLSLALAGRFFTTNATREAPNLRIEVSKLFPTGRIQPATCLCIISKPRNFFTFFIIVMYLFTCLASLGVSCSTWDLPSSFQHVGSSFQHVGSSTPACAIF